MKRIVTIQDISCIGKCSLTVALPVISAMGVETAVLPTAVLSTHTMFPEPVIRDLTDLIEPIGDHWAKEQFTFDGIYVGYLGSVKQVELVRTFLERFRDENTCVILDPVMADGGAFYHGFDQRFAGYIRELLELGDLVVPNMTEAAILTGLPYYEPEDSRYDASYVQEMLLALREKGAGNPLITGVSFAPDRIGALGLMGEKTVAHFAKRLPVSYHGTGDIFASTCAGALVRGLSGEQAVSLAVDFTAECIRVTMEDPERRSYGVNFEQALPWLIRRIMTEAKEQI